MFVIFDEIFDCDQIVFFATFNNVAYLLASHTQNRNGLLSIWRFWIISQFILLNLKVCQHPFPIVIHIQHLSQFITHWQIFLFINRRFRFRNKCYWIWFLDISFRELFIFLVYFFDFFQSRYVEESSSFATMKPDFSNIRRNFVRKFYILRFQTQFAQVCMNFQWLISILIHIQYRCILYHRD